MTIFQTLRSRVILSYIVILVFSLSLTAWLLDRSLERQAVDGMKAALSAEAGLIASQLDAGALRRGDSAAVDREVKALGASTGARVTVLAPSGRVLGDSALPFEKLPSLDSHAGRPEIVSAASGAAGVAVRPSTTLGPRMLYLAVPAGSPAAGFVRLAVPLSGAGSALAGLRRTLAFAFGLSALFALAVGWAALSFTNRQFKRIVSGSKAFAAGDFGYRIPLGSSGELLRLSETLNFMAGEIGRRMREAELRRLELEAAFRDMDEALIVTDGSGVITRMNPRARRLMGAENFEPEGMRLSAMPGGGELSSAAIKALASARPVTLEFRPDPAGSVLGVSASPIIEAGAVGGCVLVARDVTGQRRLEEMRREFVANVSHELKTPLTAIRGAAETLLDGALSDPENGPAFARSVLEQAVRLDRLVDDLLRLSYAESGKEGLDISEFPADGLADEAWAAVAGPAGKRGVTFSNLAPEGLKIKGDRAKLLQVLINLFDNAVKYNKEGGKVRFSASRGELSVSDEGQGIPPEHLPRLFERFYRADKARSRELGGTGLGLSIVKRLVELHGGSVRAESVPAKGSTFVVSLP